VPTLQVLHRLTLGVQPAAEEADGSAESAHGGGLAAPMGPPLSACVQRQTARLLAILAAHEEALVWKPADCICLSIHAAVRGAPLA
jgi:hypothetical protein